MVEINKQAKTPLTAYNDNAEYTPYQIGGVKSHQHVFEFNLSFISDLSTVCCLIEFKAPVGFVVLGVCGINRHQTKCPGSTWCAICFSKPCHACGTLGQGRKYNRESEDKQNKSHEDSCKSCVSLLGTGHECFTQACVTS